LGATGISEMSLDSNLINAANIHMKVIYDQFKDYDLEMLEEFRRQFNLAEAAWPVLTAVGMPNQVMDTCSDKIKLLDKLIALVKEVQGMKK